MKKRERSVEKGGRGAPRSMHRKRGGRQEERREGGIMVGTWGYADDEE